jgi:hypothetical protein
MTPFARFYSVCFALTFLFPSAASAQRVGQGPLPDIHQLMNEVHDHQRALDKVRENYTYSSTQTTQEIDPKGQVKKTEVFEFEKFFVNGHLIARKVKKDGQPLSEHDQQKETERVTKLVEKAQNTASDQPLEGQQISLSRILDIMEVRNPRRENYRGRPAIVFDFIGKKDVKTHGLAEDVSKKIQGTVWIDEADRVVAHLEASFNDNFRVGGGLLATIEKGSNLHFDQAPVNGEIWLPTGGEANMQARLLLLKGIHEHNVERDYNFQRFHVEAEQMKDAKAVVEKKP